jgi:hypothetical protein
MKLKVKLDTNDEAVVVLDDADTIEKAAEYLSSVNVKWLKLDDGKRVIFTKHIIAVWEIK